MSQPSFPEMYEHHLVGPLFRPFAEAVLDHTAVAPGDRVLDVDCCTGIVARLAKQRLGDSCFVAGVEVSRGMLSVARRSMSLPATRGCKPAFNMSASAASIAIFASPATPHF